jgi:hypothetical protein
MSEGKKDRFADGFEKYWRHILRREMMSSKKIDAELLKSNVVRLWGASQIIIFLLFERQNEYLSIFTIYRMEFIYER